MVKRHTIPPRSPQIEGDSRTGEGGEAPEAQSESKPPSKPLGKRQEAERAKTFGREQGGNQQGNQRGLGNPGDR